MNWRVGGGGLDGDADGTGEMIDEPLLFGTVEAEPDGTGDVTDDGATDDPDPDEVGAEEFEGRVECEEWTDDGAAEDGGAAG